METNTHYITWGWSQGNNSKNDKAKGFSKQTGPYTFTQTYINLL